MTKKSIKRENNLGIRYESVLGDISDVVETARRSAACSVNCIMTAAYWLVGRGVVEFEQAGEKRAEYGTVLIERLAIDLTQQFGRGFSRQNIQYMRSFYIFHPIEQICQTLSGKLAQPSEGSICQRRSENAKTPSAEVVLRSATELFPLPWSAYVRLLSVKDENARQFYEIEALRGGWSVRQLDRQINSQFYERTALSRNKAAMLSKGQKALPEDAIRVEEQIKDPYVLEFLGLKDEYSETELEDALIRHLETFLLELGDDFCFVGRQKRLRIGDEWYRVDLLLFHRKLRCLVIVDLKIGKFTHADAGQMHLYLNYARERWVLEGENPPVGMILCAQKDESIARYALEGLPNKVMASEYRTTLPDVKELVALIDQTRSFLEKHKPPDHPSQPS
ncbi:YhcG family protein [Thermodesulfobacteriota bacterium]